MSKERRKYLHFRIWNQRIATFLHKELLKLIVELIIFNQKQLFTS